MRRYMRFGLLLVAVIATVAMVPRIVSSREEVRDVTLVVRNMTYYAAGGEAPNPPLRFRAGEQVRVTVRSEDEGMTHDFNIRDWGVASRTLEGKGETSVTFRVPGRSSASTTYACTPHSAMMAGAVIVE